MQALGIPPEVIDRCQNHVSAGSRVRRHYMIHEYDEEKREAWDRLGTALAQILAQAEATRSRTDVFRPKVIAWGSVALT